MKPIHRSDIFSEARLVSAVLNRDASDQEGFPEASERKAEFVKIGRAAVQQTDIL